VKQTPSAAPRNRCAVFVLAWSWFLTGLVVSAAEVIPPPPKAFFNDYAHVVSPATAARLNQTLEDFERATSSQILVAIFPGMQSDSSIEDYTVRVAQSWKVGQKGKDNGAVLFVFIENRQMFIQVGYGLEGALPDALAKQIIENEIKPRFRSGDYDGGITAGVTAMLAATKGEYKGTGRTVGGAPPGRRSRGGWIVFLIIIALLLASRRRRRRGIFGRTYLPWGAGWTMGGGGFSNSGWGGGGAGGGGFSGGGGRFGGGGAGGSW
jgi:uncharacterized protein